MKSRHETGSPDGSHRRERPSMLKELWRRTDTRTEAIGVALLFVAIVSVALAQRRSPPPPPGIALKAIPGSTASVNGWTVSLARLESCPSRGVVIAVLEVQGISAMGASSPLAEPAIDGLSPDGGFWAGPTSAGVTESFAGAGGAPESFRTPPQAGAAVLRFRGRLSRRAVRVCARISGARICLPAAAPTIMPAAIGGAVGSILGR